MERVHPPPPPPPPHSSTKMERRIIEKNRRNNMKSLYSKLYSLLPSYSSKEVLSVQEQIDEAAQYIKSLQVRIEKCKEKKENLLRKKRPSEKKEMSSSRLPQFEILEMGPDMDVILISGLDKHDKFYSILRWVHQEGFEVVNASFSSSGNSMIQVAHAKVGKSRVGIRASSVAGRLEEVICGYPKPQLDLWDLEIEAEIWSSEILNTLPIFGAGELCMY